MYRSESLIAFVLTGVSVCIADPALAGTELERLGMDTWPTRSAHAPVVPRGGAPVAAALILEETAAPPGGGGLPVSVLNAPFTNGLGEVGFVGALDDAGVNDHFVWFDDQLIWRNSDAVGVNLSGGEGTMGISDDAGFIYSPSVDGDDGVWTHNGLLAVEGTQAPGFADGTTTTFHSRPTMTAAGVAYWVSGYNETGGTGTEGRVLYAASDATPASISIVLRSGDLVDGMPITGSSGIGFDYKVSDSSEHHIHALQLDTGGGDVEVVYVDGAVVAREAETTGDGDNWQNMDVVSINDAGNHLFSGDTDADSSADEFIAYDGAIVVREGDSIGGVTLASASVQTLSLNNLGQAAYIWSVDGVEHLFATCDAADLAASSQHLLATGDTLDFDGDASADATVTGFNASSSVGPGLDLAENGRVLVEVSLDTGGPDETDAIVELAMPICDRLFANGFETL